MSNAFVSNAVCLHRHQFIFLVTTLLTLWCLSAESTRAYTGIVLDQEFKLPYHTGLNYSIGHQEEYLAQTFTVQNTGELAGVGVQASISEAGQFTDDLHIRVTKVDEDGFALQDQVLARATIAPSNLPIDYILCPATITDVDLSHWHVPVVAGDRLAILISSSHRHYDYPYEIPYYLWFFQTHNPHPGGEYSIYAPERLGPTPLRDIWLGGGDTTVDAGFRVYVNVIPEPNSLLLLLCGAAGCYCWSTRTSTGARA